MAWFWSTMVMVLGLGSVASAGPSSCLPSYTSAQVLSELDQGWRLNTPLWIQRNDQLIPSLVRLEGHYEESLNSLSFLIRFDPDFDGVSLPYNLYAVLVIVNGEVEAWWDFTRSCTGPGLGFFPGQVVQLPALKLSTKAKTLQITVWGRL